MKDELRKLPSIDRLIQSANESDRFAPFGSQQTTQALRLVVESARQQILNDQVCPSEAALLEAAWQTLAAWFQPTLIPLINATGVILHTNLGRAPLSADTINAMRSVAAAYNNLEFDLESGKRDSRSVHAEALLVRLTGAEAATVVNNNAAAVLLALSALANRRKVIIARSQLIEIGGGFRIPDVMKQSGAKLVEVGTTNRVHLRDYEEALQNQAALVMRAHHSNFRLQGFTHEAGLEEICAVANQFSVPVLDDLGSGTFLDTAQYGLPHEPTIQESLAAGADLICFSGDKLLGGPQAGILIGKRELIQKIKRHPLARAVRPDKVTLAGLSATLLHYLRGDAEQQIPIWRMIAAAPNHLQQRALGWQSFLGVGSVVPSLSTIGGGSLPQETLPGFVLALSVPKPDQFLAHLRQQPIPIIARIEANQVLLDPRTVLPEQDSIFLETIRNVYAHQITPRRKK
ncbi:MAG: L-seryl-tRNA(Sec) selenium transferase [Chloroflexi bacterium HGW-Chloroflexi-10]|nr:MAG: L-seryl-tRNA(Sec) selenium transferase [Chloroflexi bacterium HGW-Chloroflexi-10]